MAMVEKALGEQEQRKKLGIYIVGGNGVISEHSFFSVLYFDTHDFETR